MAEQDPNVMAASAVSGLAKALARLLLKFSRVYFGALDDVFMSTVGRRLPRWAVEDERAESIDARVAKLDDARRSLLESLSAIDDLKIQADENRQARDDALMKIAQLEQQRTVAERELDTLRRVSDLDAGALKKLFEVPTPGRIWRERLYGFVSGIIGSIIASLIWAAFHLTPA